MFIRDLLLWLAIFIFLIDFVCFFWIFGIDSVLFSWFWSVVRICVLLYDIAYRLCFIVHLFSTFYLIEKIEKMARLIGNFNYVDLSDPDDYVSTSYVVHPKCSIVGVSNQPDACWIPSIGKLFCFVFVILFDTVSLFYFIIILRCCIWYIRTECYLWYDNWLHSIARWFSVCRLQILLW